MKAHADLASQEKRRGWMLEIGEALYVIVLFLLLLFLGLSMVNHRFFQGERVHQNGSVGQ